MTGILSVNAGSELMGIARLCALTWLIEGGRMLPIPAGLAGVLPLREENTSLLREIENEHEIPDWRAGCGFQPLSTSSNAVEECPLSR
jgi:hypothetical protein